MTPTTLRRLALALGLAAVATACEDPLVPELNNPTLPENGTYPNPSRALVEQLAIGLIAADRVDQAAFIRDAEILGRDAYNLDGADPRWTEEMLRGPFDAGGFGARFWLNQYVVVRSADVLLRSVVTATALSEEEISATEGFTRTMKALALLRVYEAHGPTGMPVEVGLGPNDLKPVLCESPALVALSALLDSAKTDLQAGGDAFPFDLPPGFTGFDDPASFLEFNRGLAAKVLIYRAQYAQALTALSESFVDTTAALDLGVYHDYGTASGDLRNPLFNQARTLRAHPSVISGAEAGDARLAKVVVGEEASLGGITSNLEFAVYSSNSDPIPILTNEELILLRAEANLGLGAGGLVAASRDINYIRRVAGGLPLRVHASVAAALDDLLYNKRYSLLWESPSRWVDARRYNRLSALPIDRTGDVVHPNFPVPNDELNARGGNIACTS